MFLKGMLCPICKNTFLFIEAKNKSYSFKSSLNCPHCEARLQNPKHLRARALYVKMTMIFILLMSAFFYSLFEYGENSLYISAPFILLFGYWLKRSMKLKNGYITMETLDEPQP